MAVELNAGVKLRRFCFLGSLDPIYENLRGAVNIKKYLPLIEGLCKEVQSILLAQILSDALHKSTLVRRDEAVFVYAVYLAADIDNQLKKEMREAFNALIRDDTDLFLFCKYATMIRKARGRKGFSKTVRKAVSAWYEAKTPEELQTMWLSHRGQHGFTHKSLVKLCSINDKTLGNAEVAGIFLKSCTELLSVNEKAAKSSAEKAPVGGGKNKTTEKNNFNTEAASNIVLAMARLRTTKSKHEALKIIRKFKLNFNQVPRHFLQYASIVEALIPTMSYLQLLKCWKCMARHFHLDNNKIFRLCREKLLDKSLRRASHIEPITLLINLHKMGIQGDLSRYRPRHVDVMRMHFMKTLYEHSFGTSDVFPVVRSQPDLRLHITMNLQSSYKEKYLRNQNKLNYYDAALSLAFGYFKREPHVDVFYWMEQRLKLNRIFWNKDINISSAYNECINIYNNKNEQRLIAPIIQAASPESIDKKYHAFLCIVPTSGRGNPNHSSELLCKFLDKYREQHYPRAKFIILQLLKFRPSLMYSQSRVENILEICGIDEHTTTIIDNFINEKFY